jgi:type II secretory pathway pseudopilin PulG
MKVVQVNSSVFKAKLIGLTLTETMAAVIIGLLFAALVGLGANNAMKNSKLDQTAAAIRVAVSELDMYVGEHGPPTVAENEAPEDAALAFLNEFNANYASISFDIDTLKADGSSFSAESLVKTDAWKNKFLLYYSIGDGIFSVASSGPDAEFSFIGGGDASQVDDLLAVVICK